MIENTIAVVPFKFEAREVRTLLLDGQPWFFAMDVCQALGLTDTNKALIGLDDDEKCEHEQYSGSGRKPVLINESGLYSLILRSRKAEAKRFKKWVTAEVLPAIRKYGRYEDEQGKMTTLIGQTIGTDGFHMLGALIKGKVTSLSGASKRRASGKIWSQLHAAFGVRSAQDIPADQLDSARNFVAAYSLEGEWLPKTDPVSSYHYPAEWLADRNPQAPGLQIKERSGRRAVHLGLASLMTSSFKSPIWDLIKLHKASGDNVEALELEIKAYRHIIETQANILDDCAARFAAARLNTPFFSVA